MTSDKSFQALVLSLLGHGLALWLLATLPSQLETLPKSTPVEVSFLERDARSAQQFVTETEEKEDDLLEQLKSKANYLSKLTKRVKEEMRAQNTGETQNRPGAFFPNLDGATRARAQAQSAKDVDGLGPAQRSAGPFGRQVAVGGSTVGEHIPGVKEGAFTALNTDRFTYYTFFSRINEQVRGRWVSHLKDFSQTLSTGELLRLSQKERVTEIEVQLDRQGNFLRVLVYRTSGYDGLDEAATQAFSEAAPFPNPPQEMVEPDGVIRLNYGFVVQWQPNQIAVSR